MPTAESAATAFAATMSFARALDLTVDRSKSFAWGTTRTARVALRSTGLHIKHSDRNLGAHVVYTRQIRNATCVQRFVALQDFWDKLSQTDGSFRAKKFVVNAVAWPRALHAIGGTCVGRKHFHQLRVEYMKALDLHKPGASAWLQFVLDSAGGDPQFKAIVASVRDFRDLSSISSASMLDTAVRDPHVLAVSSVHQVLASRLHWVGFEVGMDGWVKDRFGWVHLVDSKWTSLEIRLQWAWEQVVSSQVSHRNDFEHFGKIDIGATRRALLNCDSFDQGVLRRHLNGSVCTNEHAYHWSQDGSHCCVACGLPDSLHHRLWTCCRSGDLRASFTPEALDLVASLPTVVSCHGWFLRSCLFEPWVQYCLSLPSQLPPPACALDGLPILDLFTDGSCLHPGSLAFRLAAWSVCLAGPCSVSYGPESCHVLAASHLWMASRKQHFVPSLKLLLRPSLTLEQHKGALKSVCGLIAKGLSTSFFCWWVANVFFGEQALMLICGKRFWTLFGMLGENESPSQKCQLMSS